MKWIVFGVLGVALAGCSDDGGGAGLDLTDGDAAARGLGDSGPNGAATGGTSGGTQASSAGETAGAAAAGTSAGAAGTTSGDVGNTGGGDAGSAGTGAASDAATAECVAPGAPCRDTQCCGNGDPCPATVCTTSIPPSCSGTCPITCEPGTCVVSNPGVCEAPAGPVGNGCCSCGDDGICSDFCRCAAPDTPIATPDGQVAIESLKLGDLVYSMDQGVLRPVPVLAVSRRAAVGHHVVRLTLATGAVLHISGGHPTADGRNFYDLSAGGQLDGVTITAVELVPYAHEHTFDILPDSDTGTYLADGVLIGSTLR